MNKALLLSATAALEWILLSNSAQAQIASTAPAPSAEAAPEASDQPQLQDIIVTAQRREESLQKTPSAVTAITSEDMIKRGITDIRALSTVAPMVQFSYETSNTKIFMRGIGQDFDGDNTDPGVALYMDQIYTPRAAAAISMFDVERIEILPGPQGTLYGRNAAGGAINIATKKPSDHFEQEGLLEGGNYGLFHASGAVNVPVTDTLAVRGAVNYERHDGYLSNGTNDRKAISARLTARFTPTDSLTILVRGEYAHDGGKGYGGVLVPFNKEDPWKTGTTPGFDNYRDYTVIKANAEISYNFGNDVILTYIPGYVYYLDKENEYIGGPTDPFSDQYKYLGSRQDQYTNELRLGRAGDKLKWVVGLYQFHSNAFNAGRVLQAPAGGPFYYLTLDDGPARTKADSYAAYAQGTYSTSSSTRITLGTRYSNDRKTAAGVTSVANYIPTFSGNPPIIGITPFTARQKSQNVDGKIGIEKDVLAHSMLYGSLQTGYIAGGYNAVPATSQSGIFKPEHVYALTLGSKSRFSSNRLEINNEGFFYIYKNLQVNAYDVLSGTTPVYNVDRAIIYGLQTQITYLLGNTRLSGNIGLISAKIDKGILPPTSAADPRPFIDYHGYDLPKTANVSLTFAIEHQWHLGNGGQVSGYVGTHYEGKSWALYSHDNGSRIDDYTKTDLTLTYTPPSGTWYFGIWAKNVENSAVMASEATTGIDGLLAGYIEPPRTFGVRFGIKH